MFDSASGNTYRWCACRRLLLCSFTLMALFGIFALLVKMRKNAVEFAHCARCQSNLKVMSLALLNYHERHGAFPPAYFCDASGKPVNSWRLVVADMVFYVRTVSTGYDLSRPFDGPGNEKYKLRNLPVEEFHCPSAGNEGTAFTNYIAVVGPNTMWPGSEPMKPAADGSDKDKILLIEIVNSDILWMDPQDLTLDQALDAILPKKGVGIGSAHTGCINYVTVGGDVRTLDRNIDRESLRKLRTSSGATGKTGL